MTTEIENTKTKIEDTRFRIIYAARCLENYCTHGWDDYDFAENWTPHANVEDMVRSIMHDLNELRKLTDVLTVAFQEKG